MKHSVHYCILFLQSCFEKSLYNSLSKREKIPQIPYYFLVSLNPNRYVISEFFITNLSYILHIHRISLRSVTAVIIPTKQHIAFIYYRCVGNCNFGIYNSGAHSYVHLHPRISNISTPSHPGQNKTLLYSTMLHC